MFMMCGYNFCADGNALDPAPIINDTFTDVILKNGVFDHWNATRDVASEYPPTIPTSWDYLTVMDANFNGNIESGNSDFSLGNIDGIKIKRRKTTDFNWVTLTYIKADELNSLNFTFNDNLAASGYTYEYAFVPVVAGVEGNYITNTIGAKFDGVFICDLDTIYKFYAGVEYGTREQVQKIGIFEPYGRKYPVVVSNGLINYATGSFSGTVLPGDYFDTRNFDRLKIVQEQDLLIEFLTNKRAKILKDWNGNSWLMIIVDNPAVSYEKNSGMGMVNVEASWVELGDSDKQADLYNSGIIKEAE